MRQVAIVFVVGVAGCGRAAPSSERPEVPPSAARLGELDPILKADANATDEGGWPGYPASVQAQFAHARDVLGDDLEGWTLGSLAPALLHWVGPGKEVPVWTLFPGSGCEAALLRRSQDPAPSEVDTLVQIVLHIEESVENGARTRTSGSGTLGHEFMTHNGGLTERYENGAWVEAGGFGIGDPPDAIGTLSSIDDRVARYEAPEGRPSVECATPALLPCDGGGARLCPSCAHLRVRTIYPSGSGGGGVGFGGVRCHDPCPPRGPDHPELVPLRQLLERYGGFQTREAETGAALFRRESDCQAEAAARGR